MGKPLMLYGSRQSTGLAAKVGMKHRGADDVATSQAAGPSVTMVLNEKKDLGGRRVVRLKH